MSAHIVASNIHQLRSFAFMSRFAKLQQQVGEAGSFVTTAICVSQVDKNTGTIGANASLMQQLWCLCRKWMNLHIYIFHMPW
jgi:hypothetical protein